MVSPAGSAATTRHVVVVGVVDVAKVAAVVGAAAADRAPVAGPPAAGDRARAATRAAHAAGNRNRMDPRFLFHGWRARVQDQPVDNVTNPHTPVDGAALRRG